VFQGLFDQRDAFFHALSERSIDFLLAMFKAASTATFSESTVRVDSATERIFSST
jgi:hypothetical protein